MTASEILVEGGHRLRGTLRVAGAKNAVLPLMAAALMANDTTTLLDAPDISDVAVLCRIIEKLGGSAVMRSEGELAISSARLLGSEVDGNLAGRMRYSILLLAPLLHRFGRVHLPLPGGDAIGRRRNDTHIQSLKALGAEVTEGRSYIAAEARRLVGTRIDMGFPSVSGTEQTIMAAAVAEGETTISNFAKDPEIDCLIAMLKSCGCQIEKSSETITIWGVERDHIRGTTFGVMPDRIEACTYMIASAITDGVVKLKNVPLQYLGKELDVMQKAGVSIQSGNEGEVQVSMKEERIQPVSFETGPYPEFYTDIQPLMSTLLTLATGQSTITETLYEDRFTYVAGLRSMGADIETIDQHRIVVRGVGNLRASRVRTNDIRSGMALVLAGLAAEGQSVITEAHHIYRGYANPIGKLKSLGACIEEIEAQAEQ